jgi:hypothetical protein
MNDIVPVAAGSSSRAVTTPFKTEAEVREHFARIINQKRLLWKAGLVVGSVVVLGLSWGIISAAVMSGLGLLALGGMVFAAGVAKHYLPVLWQKIDNNVIELRQREANRHLAALKAEARRNPIEQHENSLRTRRQQLQAVKKALEHIKGRKEAWAQRLVERKRQLKARGEEEDLSREEQAVSKMEQFYIHRKDRWLNAIRACDAKERLLESLRFKWEFAKEAGELAGQLDPSAEEVFMQQLLDDEAARAVETDFNTTMAQIDLDVSELNSGKQLSFDGDVIDIASIHIPTTKELEHVAIR